MDIEKLKYSELENFDLQKICELDTQIRQELLKLRLDVYAEKGKHSSKAKNLKKQLARVLTAKTKLSSKQ